MALKGNTEKKLNGTVIVTYRCNARCSMCNRYKAPSRPEEEISIETIRKLPKMYFTNITGGEPFIRTDLKDIVRELYKKSDRIVISTNGFFTDRIVDLCKEFPQIGIRISIEGLQQTNDEIRGLPNGYQRGYTTLKKLRQMGMKDVGFGMTVQDRNAPDLVPLYKISDELGMEFATASLHNSFYFVEAKNIIHDRPMVAKNFEDLINELLRSNSPKKWFRAYFNHGLINYIYGQPRLLPCDMSFDTFFIDPYGDVMPCNGTKDKEVMGNLNEQTWDELWNSPEAEKVREKVRHCDRQCWMIGSVSPAMHKYIWVPAAWVAEHKAKALFSKKPYSMYENKICCDYRDGKVTKEELDRCSTCDFNAVVSNGLSKSSQEQLKDKSGEEIVEADLARQQASEKSEPAKKAAKAEAKKAKPGKAKAEKKEEPKKAKPGKAKAEKKEEPQAGEPEKVTWEEHKLSSLQEQDLVILKEFQRICDEYGLRYFVVAGSMLGAVRHQGFIPWDDDIDVAMPREDYDKFLKVAPRMLSDEYRLETPRQRDHVTIVSTITSKKGGFTLNNAEKALHTGAWIDIMMIDGVPDPGIKRTIHYYRYMALRALYQISHFDEVVDQNRERPAYEKAIIDFAKVTKIQRFIDPKKVNRSIEKLMRSVPYDSSNYVATYCGIYRQNEIVPKSWYGKGKKYSFEDTEVYGLADADKYLTQLYGDYMTPPADTSVSKHNVKEETQNS